MKTEEKNRYGQSTPSSPEKTEYSLPSIYIHELPGW